MALALYKFASSLMAAVIVYEGTPMFSMSIKISRNFKFDLQVPTSVVLAILAWLLR